MVLLIKEIKHKGGGKMLKIDGYQRKEIDSHENSTCYRKKVVEIVEKIDNLAALKRIYKLAEYLYIHKTEKE